MNRQYGITGLLYWTTFTYVSAPWHSPAISHWNICCNGGGYLLYPGLPCGMEGPVHSMRLKVVRDSMEDYEYFVLLEQRGGADALRPCIDRIAPNWWDIEYDPDVLLEERRKIAEAIVAARR